MPRRIHITDALKNEHCKRARVQLGRVPCSAPLASQHQNALNVSYESIFCVNFLRHIISAGEITIINSLSVNKRNTDMVHVPVIVKHWIKMCSIIQLDDTRSKCRFFQFWLWQLLLIKYVDMDWPRNNIKMTQAWFSNSLGRLYRRNWHPNWIKLFLLQLLEDDVACGLTYIVHKSAHAFAYPIGHVSGFNRNVGWMKMRKSIRISGDCFWPLPAFRSGSTIFSDAQTKVGIARHKPIDSIEHNKSNSSKWQWIEWIVYTSRSRLNKKLL